jgi:hypothetical protein
MRFLSTLTVLFGALFLMVAAAPTDHPTSPKNIEGTLARISAMAAAAPTIDTTNSTITTAVLDMQCGVIYRVGGGSDIMSIYGTNCRSVGSGVSWNAMDNYGCGICMTWL